ncbi:MAG: ABC transporter permease [Acidimicrobiia bacterium]
MSERGPRVVRVAAFLRKDLFEVMRQPRILLTLVLGPFLILLIFGAGFAPNPPALRTVLVVPETMADDGAALAERIGGRIDLVETTTSESHARNRLAEGSADVLVVIPADAAALIRDSQHAEIGIYHDVLDPFERSMLVLAADSAVDEVNREILEQVIAQRQADADDFEDPLTVARRALDSMSTALDRGDELDGGDRAALRGSLATLRSTTSASETVLARTGGTGVSERLKRVEEDSARLERGETSREESTEIVSRMQEDLAQLEADVRLAKEISPEVLVSPFVAKTENFRGVSVPYSDFYVPGVVVLLVQHLALTFAALSLVRERTLGTVELFRVSPLSGGEALIGKYLAYSLLGALVATGLTVGAVAVLGFDLAGSWWWYSAVVFLVLLAALGAGFVVSAIARTESEAVQYAMIMLLVAIFFSGFVTPLDRLHPAVRLVSYLIPATHGIAGLQDVSFRAESPSAQAVGGLAILAGGFLVVAWTLIRTRVMAGATRTRRTTGKHAGSQVEDAFSTAS